MQVYPRPPRPTTTPAEFAAAITLEAQRARAAWAASGEARWTAEGRRLPCPTRFIADRRLRLAADDVLRRSAMADESGHVLGPSIDWTCGVLLMLLSHVALRAHGNTHAAVLIGGRL